MKLTPLASDSMGARAMCFLVETDDIRIVIDPAVALGPIRFGLPPHPRELARFEELQNRVFEEVRKADVTTISHYHFDHHDPEHPDIYQGKRMLIKHPLENINKSQTKRSKDFLKLIDGKPKSIEHADGQTFKFGDTKIEFSEAQAHGTNTKLGYVIQLAVTDGDMTFVHTSDVEGPSLDDQLDFILKQQPDVLACDGPMTYLMYKYGRAALERSINNLKRIIDETPVQHMLLDHHLCRDGKWREKMVDVIKHGEGNDCKVQSFAEYAGLDESLLESQRKILHEEEPDELGNPLK